MTVDRIKSHDLRFTLPIFEALMRSTSMSLSFCATCPGLSPRIMEMVSLMSAEISPCVLARVIKPVERGGACCGQSADDEQCSVNATSSPPPARLRSTLAIAAALLIVSALLATCLGAEIMQHIAAPMVGDMLTAPPLSMLVIPAAYPLMPRRTLPALSHV